MNLRQIVVSTVILALATAALTPVAASATGPSAPIDPSVASLAAEQGLSVAEAQRRINWQPRAATLDETLRRGQPDYVAGVWIDEEDGGRVKVGVAGRAPAPAPIGRDIVALGLQDVTDLVPVRFSWTDLLAPAPLLTTRLDAANQGSDVRLVPTFEPQHNRISLYVPQSGMTAAQRDLVAQVEARFADRVTFASYPGRVHLDRCGLIGSSYDCDKPLRGGVTIYDDERPICSTAFNARSISDGKWYMMTAAHCGPKGMEFWAYQPDALWFSKIGAVHNRGEPSAFNDYSIITINNPAGWDPQPWVYVKASVGRGVAGTTTNSQYTINATGSTVVTQRVCAVTAFTGTSCGRVTQVGYPNPGDFAIADYCTQDGDSGGAVVNNHIALGIHFGNFGAACGVSAYVGITEAQQALNVRVVTA